MFGDEEGEVASIVLLTDRIGAVDWGDPARSKLWAHYDDGEIEVFDLTPWTRAQFWRCAVATF